VTGEEDIDLLGILPPLAVFAFFYFLVAPVRELATRAALGLLSNRLHLDWPWVSNKCACVCVCAQPVIMNWMRLRWYKREFVETYLQFMFTYLFYPAWV
jgi:hypothetical protein